jgi:hypothetical protein
MKKVRLFKFLKEGLKSNYNGFQWEIGKWHKTECLELCHGFNCSEKILDALNYVKGEILAEVEAKGKHFSGNDKSTWPQMRIIRAWKWTKKDSVALAIFSAESAIEVFEKEFPKDDRPHKAIEAAKAWLKNPAAYAAYAAYAAAYAARAAAYAAAYAARAAADAASDKINGWLINHLSEMEEWTDPAGRLK